MRSVFNQPLDLRDSGVNRRAADRLCNLHLVDTMGLADVTVADAGSSGSSGDWADEIHLTRGGYRKCTAVWADVLDALPE